MSDGVEWLVLVDENDRELGLETRENCHRGMGIMHRAFVVFLFKNDGKMLLQRRSMKKKLWPGRWDVSVTSHVYKGETYEHAGIRRSLQELNAEVKSLERVLDYTYWAKYGEYAENEYCVLLIGGFDGKIKPNPDEIMETKYSTLEDLSRDVTRNEDAYTPWFKIAFERYMRSTRSKG